LIRSLPINEKRALCIVREISQNLKRASRNTLNWVDVKSARDVNAYQILQREKLVIEEGALPVLEEKLLSSKKNRLPQGEAQEEKDKKKS
jgi:large subunit ribosomal protein L4